MEAVNKAEVASRISEIIMNCKNIPEFETGRLLGRVEGLAIAMSTAPEAPAGEAEPPAEAFPKQDAEEQT